MSMSVRKSRATLRLVLEITEEDARQIASTHIIVAESASARVLLRAIQAECLNAFSLPIDGTPGSVRMSKAHEG
jgi:hypothetical protein